MKSYLILILAFIIHQNSFGQNLTLDLRVLKISDHESSVINRIKKNRKGEMVRFEQTIHKQQKDTLTRIAETYKKDKFWTVRTTRDIIHSEKDIIKEAEDYYVVKEIDETVQEFDQEGKILYDYLYIAGVPKSTYLGYYYYPNGNLKMVAELKGETIWNIILFKNIDGRRHDFGNYKDGSGTIIWLNDNGEPCSDCSLRNHQNN